MDCEKILFCYRDDKVKKPVAFETGEETKVVAAIPCTRAFLKKELLISRKRIKKDIAKIYETSGAQFLWLDDELCSFLQVEKMELPQILLVDWLSQIPFFHTLIFADNGNAGALEHISQKTDKLAGVCVVCYEKFVEDYEELASILFQREGIVLQIFTYEGLESRADGFREQVILKGRAALLDFEERRSFWDRRLGNEISYYSFLNENRLFLDTFRKNRYNTLTK